MSIVTELAILVLAAFVGFEVISKVPNTLHTPLMSGTNAIHGIVVLGGVLLMHEANGILEHVLLVIAITFGTINVVGGFLVTDRMLGMFKKKPDPVESAGADSIGSSAAAALPAGAAKAGSGASELPGGADPAGAEPGGAAKAGSGGSELPGGADPGGADPGGADPAGGDRTGARPATSTPADSAGGEATSRGDGGA
jgi:H+-translocating NAD(P) transhydrogenase subunit alpha